MHLWHLNLKSRTQRRDASLGSSGGRAAQLQDSQERSLPARSVLQLGGDEPHFGTRAAESFLQRAAATLLEAVPQVVREDFQGVESVGRHGTPHCPPKPPTPRSVRPVQVLGFGF